MDERNYELGKQIGRIEAGIDSLLKATAEDREENRKSHKRIENKMESINTRVGVIEQKVSALEQWREDVIMFSDLSPRTKAFIVIGGSTGLVSLTLTIILKILNLWA